LKKSLAGREAKNVRLLGVVARVCQRPQERKFFCFFFFSKKEALSLCTSV
jgi:hypothetical protein